MKKSLGMFPQEDAHSLKEALLAEGIVSEIDPFKYVKEDDLKYMPVFTGRVAEDPRPNALISAAVLEVLVMEENFDRAKKVQDSLGIVSIQDDVSILKNKLNLSESTLDKGEDFLKAFQLTGAGMDMFNRSKSGRTMSPSSTDMAFLSFIFNQKTRDYFKTGFGKKLLIGFVVEIIVSLILLFTLPVNIPTGFILLLLVWSGLMVMSFPYRERFGSRIINIYVWIVNIIALLALFISIVT